MYENNKFLLITSILIICVCFILAGILFFTMQKKKPELIAQTFIIGTSASITTSLLLIAEEQGFFDKEGIYIDIRLYKSAALGLDDMIAGNIHIAGVAETPIVYRSFDYNDFQVFATILTSNNDPKIIARQDKGIKIPADLVGKRIGSTKKGQSAHFFLHLFLLKHVLSSENVTIIHDSPSNIVERLNAGDIDAASLFEPYVFFAKKRLGDKGVIFAEPGIYFKTFNLVAKKQFLQNNPEPVRRILRALIKAEKFVIKEPEQTIKIISSQCAVEQEIVKEYLAFSNMEITLSDALVMSLEYEAKWAVQSNLLSGHTDIPNYLNFIHTDALETIRPESISIIK